MSIDRAELAEKVALHGRVARVVVAAVDGSAPREVGAAMLVWAGGQSGTIGGGALEHSAAQQARRLLADGPGPRLHRIPLGPALGQCCGGAVQILTELFDQSAVLELPEHVHARPVIAGTAMPFAVRRMLHRARASGQPPSPGLISGWMVEPITAPATMLWIHGAGHVGRALVAVLAPLPGFAITWVDTAADRFPEDVPAGVTKLVAAIPSDAVPRAPADAHHLILTYSHALDLALCHSLLCHGFASAGLIGSATKWARFRSRLSQLGHSDAHIARICCPIGQPSLGKHPQAIAVGVASALLSQHRERQAMGGTAG